MKFQVQRDYDPLQHPSTGRKIATDSLNPLLWGWKLDGSKLQPIMTDLEPAPESLLKFVRCKCKLSTTNPCGSNICSCRKHGLKCVTACGDCRGESCTNAKNPFTMTLTIPFFQILCESHLYDFYDLWISGSRIESIILMLQIFLCFI